MDIENFHTDPNLIARCRRGEPQAQFMLYKQYSKAMYNIAIRITNNSMDAEDILQESFITAFERLSEMINPDSFASWLKRIVINRSIDLVRKSKPSFVDLNEELHDGLDPEEETDFIPEPEVVHHAIRNLPGGSRTVLVLHALEGYKHKDIASMLGISESTSKTQYKRALELLNRDLKEKIYVR
jgi:RNA polymerase sigma factor (sigma-70 family)